MPARRRWMRRPPSYTQQSPYLRGVVSGAWRLQSSEKASGHDGSLQAPLTTPLLLSLSMVLEVVHGYKEQLRVAGGPVESNTVAFQDKERCWSMIWGFGEGNCRVYLL